ncbi:MAG: hypothetical protein ACKO96_28555 [Flammeovirgaceae bacterium]
MEFSAQTAQQQYDYYNDGAYEIEITFVDFKSANSGNTRFMIRQI